MIKLQRICVSILKLTWDKKISSHLTLGLPYTQHCHSKRIEPKNSHILLLQKVHLFIYIIKMCFDTHKHFSLSRDTELNGWSHAMLQNMQGFFFLVDFLPVCTETAFQHFDRGQFCEIVREGFSFLQDYYLVFVQGQASPTEKTAPLQPCMFTRGCRISTENTVENLFGRIPTEREGFFFPVDFLYQFVQIQPFMARDAPKYAKSVCKEFSFRQISYQFVQGQPN